MYFRQWGSSSYTFDRPTQPISKKCTYNSLCYFEQTWRPQKRPSPRSSRLSKNVESGCMQGQGMKTVQYQIVDQIENDGIGRYSTTCWLSEPETAGLRQNVALPPIRHENASGHTCQEGTNLSAVTVMFRCLGRMGNIPKKEGVTVRNVETRVRRLTHIFTSNWQPGDSCQIANLCLASYPT